eukprot:757316_1
MDAEFFACVQKDKDKCYERLKKESPLMPLDFLSNTYFISAMTIGHQANFPYFPYLCDVFLRQYHDYSENDYARPQSWMHYYEHEYLKHLQDDALTRTLLIAIHDYFNRLFPRMIVPQPTTISDSLPVVSAHVLMFCNIVKQLSSYDSITPYQLELCFLFKSFDIDDDSDDSDERDDSDESDDCDDFGIFGDIACRLTTAKLQYHEFNINETYDLDKSIMDTIKSNYQQKRLVALIDRKVNKLYLYESPPRYAPVTKDSTTQTYMNNARHILVPPDISCMSECNGNMLTFSFHVRHQNDVRCYMYRHGEIMRFMPADVIGKVMAQLFIESQNNTDFIESEQIASLVKDTKYNLVDVAFARFCHNVKIFEIKAKDRSRYRHYRREEYLTGSVASEDNTEPTIDDDLHNILRPQLYSKMDLMQYFFTLFHANFRDNAAICKLTKHKLEGLKLKAFHRLELMRRVEKLKMNIN